MIIYPAPEAGLVLLLCLVWVILETRKKTAKERKARRQERLEANRAQIKENIQAIGKDLRKIRYEDKIALLSIFVVFVLAALALWFFLG